ncbi:PREDICTED: E3 ubiquitin-protein ligase TRIM38, partial [Myotis davidii]|uniref:E3 ubiquitin-protein ligase TRIM38 n=1 Tax=Myotis davidii TaxID=225400 RepID=UPI0007673270
MPLLQLQMVAGEWQSDTTCVFEEKKNILSERHSLRPIKQLGSLIDALREQEQEQEEQQQQQQQQEQQLDQEPSCQEHGERLHLFCEDDGQLICWRCERHGQHKGHNTELLEDVSPGYREKLQEAVRKLRQLEEECTNQKAFMAMQIAQWKVRMGGLSPWPLEGTALGSGEESEEERILQRLRVSEADLDQQSRQLESHILELEERCQGSAQKLLQDVKGALSRSQAVRLETPEALVLEIETECDVPEVYFDLRKRLRRHQVGVTLDPETAHPELILSQDQRQVTRGPQGDGDLSPWRFMALPCILGRQSFAAGRQYFEVDVGEGTGWDVGVCLESVQ